MFLKGHVIFLNKFLIINIWTKCSYNFGVIKMNEKQKITSVSSALYLCNKVSMQ